MRDFGHVYNATADRYTGDIEADLSELGIPPDLAIAVAQRCAEWAVSPGQLGTPPPAIAAGMAFTVGVMTGVAWERER